MPSCSAPIHVPASSTYHAAPMPPKGSPTKSTKSSSSDTTTDTRYTNSDSPPAYSEWERSTLQEGSSSSAFFSPQPSAPPASAIPTPAIAPTPQLSAIQQAAKDYFDYLITMERQLDREDLAGKPLSRQRAKRIILKAIELSPSRQLLPLSMQLDVNSPALHKRITKILQIASQESDLATTVISALAFLRTIIIDGFEYEQQASTKCFSTKTITNFTHIDLCFHWDSQKDPARTFQFTRRLDLPQGTVDLTSEQYLGEMLVEAQLYKQALSRVMWQRHVCHGLKIPCPTPQTPHPNQGAAQPSPPCPHDWSKLTNEQVVQKMRELTHDHWVEVESYYVSDLDEVARKKFGASKYPPNMRLRFKHKTKKRSETVTVKNTEQRPKRDHNGNIVLEEIPLSASQRDYYTRNGFAPPKIQVVCETYKLPDTKQVVQRDYVTYVYDSCRGYDDILLHLLGMQDTLRAWQHHSGDPRLREITAYLSQYFGKENPALIVS